MCKLGFWQLERAEQKRQQLALFSQQGDLSADDLIQLNSETLERLNGRSIQLSGDIEIDKVWLLDNQTYQGQVGYSVITPLKVLDGQLSILVNWGWIKAGKYRHQIPQIQLPNNINTSGLIRTTDFAQFRLKPDQLESQSSWPKRVQSVSTIVQAFKDLGGEPVLVYAKTHPKINYPQTYQPVVMPPEKHQAYAVQWFLLAFASVLVFIYASSRNVTSNTLNKKLTENDDKDNNEG